MISLHSTCEPVGRPIAPHARCYTFATQRKRETPGSEESSVKGRLARDRAKVGSDDPRLVRHVAQKSSPRLWRGPPEGEEAGFVSGRNTFTHIGCDRALVECVANSKLDDSAFGGPAGEFMAVGHLQLAQHVRSMGFHGLDRDSQSASDLLVRITSGEQTHDFLFAR